LESAFHNVVHKLPTGTVHGVLISVGQLAAVLCMEFHQNIEVFAKTSKIHAFTVYYTGSNYKSTRNGLCDIWKSLCVALGLLSRVTIASLVPVPQEYVAESCRSIAMSPAGF
jgi:hypothetical protein